MAAEESASATTVSDTEQSSLTLLQKTEAKFVEDIKKAFESKCFTQNNLHQDFDFCQVLVSALVRTWQSA